ncbi:EamA family transporter [candidate division KSB1 bacterium]|nr:EamA family transporter [candidate division KSB1 bacterium]
MAHKKSLPVLVFIILCLIWGSTWVFIKVGLQDAPPFLSAGFRFLIAAILLYPFMRAKGLRIPTNWKILSLMVYTGIFAVSISYGLVYWSEQYISAGLTAILFSTFPFFVLFLTHFMIADDKLSLVKVLGSVVGFSGVVIIFIGNLTIANSMAVFGTAGIIISAIFAAISSVVIKKNSELLNPIVLTVVHMICGAITLLIVGFIFENLSDFKITFRSIGTLLYLAILGSCVAFICYYWLISKIKLSKAALIVFIIPIIALLLEWLWLGQALNWQVFLGSGLVLSGVGITNR